MKLFRSGIIVAFFTLISRIFGLIRELFIASLFGASDLADSVNVAFKLPNLFRRIFGEGALSTVFIPIFNAKMLNSTRGAKVFTGEIFLILLFTLIILVGVMQIFMPSLMFLVAPGFNENKEKFELTILLCRITMPYLLFVSVAALFGGILNSVGRFAAFAFSPVILSVSVIVGTLILQHKISSPVSISLSLLIAGILQVLFMFFCIVKAGLHFPLVFKRSDKDVRKFLVNMVPATISSGTQQLNLFISGSIASFIPGTVSILSYADRIYQFPLSIIGVTFSTILLPELSRIYKTDDYVSAYKVQNQAIKIGLFLSLPAAFGIIALSQPIIHIIYERGAFNFEDTVKTAETISAFALGLPAFVLTKILTPIFYANQDTKTPLKITIYSLIVNTALNLILMVPFAHVGIALGSSIASWYNVWLLYKYAKRHGKLSMSTEVNIFGLKTLFGCIVMTLTILIVDYYYGSHFYSSLSLVKISALSMTIFGSAGIFMGVSVYLGLHKILLRNTKYENTI